MLDFILNLFDSKDFMPHGHCYFWLPEVLWTHVLGDFITAFSYFAIPVGLFQLARKRKDLDHTYIFLLFGLFIFSCGSTHLIDIITIWHPVYRLESMAKLFTGIISFATAILFFNMIPVFLAIPSAQATKQKNDQLQREIEIRKLTQKRLEEKSQDILFYANALEKLERLANRNYHSTKKAVKDYLLAGCEILDMDYGMICKAEDQQFRVVHLVGKDVDQIVDRPTHFDLMHFKYYLLQEETTIFPNLTNEDDNPFQWNHVKMKSLVVSAVSKEESNLKIICFFSTEPNTSYRFSYLTTIIDVLVQNLQNRIRLIETQKKLREERILLRKGESVSHTCSWILNVNTNKLIYSPEFLKIFRLSKEQSFLSKTLFTEAMRMAGEEGFRSIMDIIKDAQKSKATWETNCEITLGLGQKKWIHIQGARWLDKNKVIGVIQDITMQKNREMELVYSNQLISEQKNRLFNFAHIVSHNLRSHVGNFGNLVKLLQTCPEELKSKVTDELNKTYTRLRDTIDRLSEVLEINAQIHHQKEKLSFTKVTEDIIKLLLPEIKKSNAEITFDFSNQDTIYYVFAYLESILQNLLSNAIKYAFPGRKPIIKITTYVEEDYTVLQVEDNGRGIDLKKHRDKLFGMYKTFHDHPDARGIGLFLTKNQIESLGGKIEVESKVDHGTIFYIYFLNKQMHSKNTDLNELVNNEI